MIDVTDLVAKPDETPTMADVRTRYEQARAGYEAAAERYWEAQKELARAIERYEAKDPGFRR